MIVSQSAFRAEADSDYDSELSSGKFRSNRYLLAIPRTSTSLTRSSRDRRTRTRTRDFSAQVWKRVRSRTISKFQKLDTTSDTDSETRVRRTPIHESARWYL